MRETTICASKEGTAMDGLKRSKFWVAYRKYVKIEGSRGYATRIEIEVVDCSDRADAMAVAKLCAPAGAVWEGID